MAPPLMSLKRVSLSFGGTPLLHDVNMMSISALLQGIALHWWAVMVRANPPC